MNNVAAERRGEFFNREFAVTNTTSAVWAPVDVVAVLKNAGSNGMDIVSSQSGHVFVAQTPEGFVHDADGNLVANGRWEFSWDGENRLTAVETRTNVTGMTRRRCEYTCDTRSRGSQDLNAWTDSVVRSLLKAIETVLKPPSKESTSSL